MLRNEASVCRFSGGDACRPTDPSFLRMTALDSSDTINKLNQFSLSF
ncbi:hypothetical protein ACFGVS_25120 [Mucilaginibacter sp. AW1-7]